MGVYLHSIEGIRFCDIKDLAFANVDYANSYWLLIRRKRRDIVIKLCDYSFE